MRSPSTLALLSIVSCLACSGSASQPQSELRSGLPRNLAPVVGSADAAQLASDNVAFACDLYAKLRASNAGNFIFSQTSISLALAMLYGGAAGDTAAQMATALHFTLPADRLHPAFDALDLALARAPSSTSADAFQLQLANSLWVQTGFHYLPAYLDLLATNYGAGLFAEDFATAPEKARLDINQWVSDETNKMIPQLFDSGTIGQDVRLVLVNAVYFHGAWSVPFSSPTAPGIFHAPAGDVSVPMMSNSKTNAALWSGAGYQAASLEYVGGTTSMILVMPDAGTFDGFEQGLSASGLGAILASASRSSGIVTMPSFRFETASPLNDILKALGMTAAFGSSADLSGIDGQRDLHVGVVIQKAVISVDEHGTKAAAATGVTSVMVSLDVPAPALLVVDRPFLFFIRHNPTGAILFQGRVVDPSR
jgi:serpin B